MMRFFEQLLVVGWLVGVGGSLAAAELPPAPQATAASVIETFDVVDLKVTGLDRTNPRWLLSYMDVALPARLSQADVSMLARKLMTTGVFTEVKVQIESLSADPSKHVLHVQVEEKWTTIPVIRGVYGGGTPLRIFGLYDIHSFGRLLTLGGEVRKYGDAAPGYVVYARDPRSQAGRYYLGAEFWRDFRRRQIYSSRGEELGYVSTNAAISRLRLLTPLAFDPESPKDYRWKYGGEVEVVQEAPSTFAAEAGQSELPPDDLDFAAGKRRQVKVLPTLLYDDVDVDIVELDGFRIKMRAGPTFAEGKAHGTSEVEFFGFEVLPYGLNLALHGFAGQTSFNSLQTQYFLGGLDSIRGMPDGAIYGNHAAYVNSEMRHLFFKAKYLWIQSVLFADAGGAAAAWHDVAENGRSSAGMGFRFAVPQIYRMLFRLDYAWSLDGSKTQGITAGMNHFFDPYTPL